MALELQKQSSSEWVHLTGIYVLDPDGWDRENLAESWTERITIDEFKARAGRSTIDLPRYREVFGG